MEEEEEEESSGEIKRRAERNCIEEPKLSNQWHIRIRDGCLFLRILLHTRRSASIETTMSSSSPSRLQLVVGILISKLPRRQITVDPNKASSPLTRGRQRFPGRGWRNTASRWLLRQRLRRRASSTIYPPIATLCEASVIDALPASTTLSLLSFHFFFFRVFLLLPFLLPPPFPYLSGNISAGPSLSLFLFFDFRIQDPCCMKRSLFSQSSRVTSRRNWKVLRAWISLIRNR